MRLKGKNVLVVGLGRSGLAATRFLADRGARVAVTDQRPEAELALTGLGGLEQHWGGHRPEIFERRDLIVVSPGVPTHLPGLERARRKRIPILGEMGLAALFLEVPMVAVTGTNGKSTTVTLLAAMLQEGGQKVALGGNIGTPLTERIMEKKRYDRVVVEVSSFQLETVWTFRPEVAVVLNITPDHLDRYADFKDYARAKMRILKDQTARDWVVYNRDDPVLIPYLRRARAKKFPFSLQRLDQGVFVSGGRIVRRGREFEDYPLDKVKLVGLHNVQNMMAAIGAARTCGVAPEAIRKGLAAFEGLPHRMQLIREHGGVRYYDDSKGTNVDAVAKSLAGFADRQVILIAGGRNKGMDFRSIRPAVEKKAKLLLLIGEAAAAMAEALQGCTEIRQAGTLQAAVQAAAAAARRGDVVLLSPACASFDQFEDYKERGEKFSEEVRGLC